MSMIQYWMLVPTSVHGHLSTIHCHSAATYIWSLVLFFSPLQKQNYRLLYDCPFRRDLAFKTSVLLICSPVNWWRGQALRGGVLASAQCLHTGRIEGSAGTSQSVHHILFHQQKRVLPVALVWPLHQWRIMQFPSTRSVWRIFLAVPQSTTADDVGAGAAD